MRLIRSVAGKIIVEMTVLDLRIAHQAMNEVAHGFRIHDDDFTTRIGSTRTQVREAMSATRAALDLRRAAEAEPP